MQLITLLVSSAHPVVPTTPSAAETKRYRWTPPSSISSSSRGGGGGGEGEERAARRGMETEGQALLRQVSSQVSLSLFLSLSLSLSCPFCMLIHKIYHLFSNLQTLIQMKVIIIATNTGPAVIVMMGKTRVINLLHAQDKTAGAVITELELMVVVEMGKTPHIVLLTRQ